jgi:hypothetical protein
VDPNGAVFAIFKGNDWKSEDALDALRRALG